MADLITMADESVETKHGITLFDPVETWKERTYVNCTGALPFHADLFPGRARLQSPSLDDIRNSAKRRSIRCGTKSSALKTRTAIMST